MKQLVHVPSDFNGLGTQIQLFGAALTIFFGKDSVCTLSLNQLLTMIGRNKKSFQDQIALVNFFATKFLFAIDKQVQCWLTAEVCRRPIILRAVQRYFWCAQQGQTQYVWGGQTIEAGFPKRRGKDSPRHRLSAGLLVLMQDWAFLRRCSVLDTLNTSIP